METEIVELEADVREFVEKISEKVRIKSKEEVTHNIIATITKSAGRDWRKGLELRQYRINLIRDLITKRAEMGAPDYFFKAMERDTGISMTTIQRLIETYLSKEVEIYKYGPLKKIRLIGKGENGKNTI
jgi:hypothetical protein